jgi:hypothetical protein
MTRLWVALLVTAPAAAGDRPRLLLDVGLTLAAMSVRGEPDTTLDLETDDETGTVEWDTEGLLRPRERRAWPSAGARLGADFDAGGGLALRGLLDTGEIRPGGSLDPPLDGPTSYGLPLDEAAAEGVFLREAVVGWLGRNASVEVGRLRSDVGAGLIWSDSGNGATADIELAELPGGPIRLEAQALLVGRRFSDVADGSTLGLLRVAVPWSWLEYLAPFAALWSDRSGAAAALLASAAAETVIAENGPIVEQFRLDQLANTSQPTAARILYFGFDGVWLPRTGMSVRPAAAAAFGSASIVVEPLRPTVPSEPADVRLRGAAGSLEVHQGLGRRWDLGGVVFALSGDRAPRLDSGEIEYTGFLAPAPWWDWTGLFFSGGLGEAFYPARAASAGINGHGAAGLGPIASWTGDRVSLEARAAWLRAITASPPPPLGGGGSMYGVEVDLRADWDVTPFWTLAGEVDVLRPGSYFPEDDAALRLLVLMDVHDAP